MEKDLIMVYIYNIWKGLWTLFRYHGEVIDAFIPAKKNESGRRFGFVRFDKMGDARKDINRLNGFVILGMIGVRDSQGKNQVKQIKGHVDDEQLRKLQKCL
ncbi:hypothetical protein Golax_011263, partial [Gossypium laxum]|nr:hypothetical protein [Gossypium laxum]